MQEAELSSVLRELTERVRRIEQHLGIASEADLSGQPVKQADAAAEPAVAQSTRSAAPPAVPPSGAELDRTTSQPPVPHHLRHEAKHWAKGKPDLAAGAEDPAQRDQPVSSLELVIGERWMAWVGGIVVVAAAGLFVKLGYDLGWWGRLSPLVKCLVAAAFGSLLVACGELALRRVGRIAATSLFGGGLGVLYLTAYASFRYFHLVSQTGAFWLMLLVAGLGFAITLRGRMGAVGVLSLLGGYLSPILLGEASTFAAALPVYVTALLAVGLGLSAMLVEPFRILRYAVLPMHVLVASTWLLREGREHWLLALGFTTAWWSMVTSEVLLAAFREQSRLGNPIVSLFFTFWYVSVGCGVLAAAHPAGPNWLGLFTGAAAAVCAWLGLALGPGLAALRSSPRGALERLVASLWAQVGILCAAALTVQFRGQGHS